MNVSNRYGNKCIAYIVTNTGVCTTYDSHIHSYQKKYYNYVVLYFIFKNFEFRLRTNVIYTINPKLIAVDNLQQQPLIIEVCNDRQWFHEYRSIAVGYEQPLSGQLIPVYVNSSSTEIFIQIDGNQYATLCEIDAKQRQQRLVNLTCKLLTTFKQLLTIININTDINTLQELRDLPIKNQNEHR